MSKQIYPETIKVKVPSGTTEKLDAAAALLNQYAPDDIRDKSSVVRLAVDYLFRCLPPIEYRRPTAVPSKKPVVKVSKLRDTPAKDSAAS